MKPFFQAFDKSNSSQVRTVVLETPSINLPCRDLSLCLDLPCMADHL
jgi:hypothetical protein